MNKKNRIEKIVDKLNKIPKPLRSSVVSFLFGRTIPYFGTTGIIMHELTTTQTEMSVKNRRRIQNHIKGVHACAMSVLAEAATGMLIGINVPDNKLPLIKSMHVEYKCRAQGDLKAVAHLEEHQVNLIRNTAKGEIIVPIKMTDESGNEPALFEMTWAWISK
jgi:acyl-coenzyme A thioesterase PaaI-like protein